MKVLPVERQENYAEKYLEGFKSQNGEHIVNPITNFETQVIGVYNKVLKSIEFLCKNSIV